MQANQHQSVLTQYRSAVSAYLLHNRIDPDMNPRAEKTLMYRIIDDERRAVWQDGLMQCHLHLRFLWTEMISATIGQTAWSDPKYALEPEQHAALVAHVQKCLDQRPSEIVFSEAVETMNFSQLIGHILNMKSQAPLACLTMALGMTSTTALSRMLRNLLQLSRQMDVLTPCEFIRGFEAVPEDECDEYRLPMSWQLPQDSDSALTAVCALVSLMKNVPVYELWRNKLVDIESLWKAARPDLKLFS